MIQQDLIDLIIRLKCCSAILANNLAEKLKIGNNCSFDNLILLNDYIKVLLKYDLNNTNCITETDFNNIITQSKKICEFCDCN